MTEETYAKATGLREMRQVYTECVIKLSEIKEDRTIGIFIESGQGNTIYVPDVIKPKIIDILMEYYEAARDVKAREFEKL